MTHAWMIGFRGDVAFAVFVANGDVRTRMTQPRSSTRFLNGLPASPYH